MAIVAPEVLSQLEKAIKELSPDPQHGHDRYVIESVKEALLSAQESNMGVGGVLVDEHGDIVERGRNRVFSPYFRSDLHSEMDLMTRAETRFKDSLEPGKLTLFSSLEPCPMCLTRLITSGVGKVYYGSPDPTGGMTTRMQSLPSRYQELARGREFAQANCSNRVHDLAWKVFEVTVEANDLRLNQRAK